MTKASLCVNEMDMLVCFYSERVKSYLNIGYCRESLILCEVDQPLNSVVTHRESSASGRHVA